MPEHTGHQSSPVSALVVDDQFVAGIGTRAILELELNWRVIAVHDNVDDAMRIVRSQSPSVVVIDLAHRGGECFRLLRELREAGSAARVLVYTAAGSPALARACLRQGAAGLACKRSPVEDFYQAARAVAEGDVYLSEPFRAADGGPDAAQPNGKSALTPLETLSPAELQVLHHIAHGRETPEIARLLERGPKTIETYRSRIRAKLGLSNSTELAQYAWQVLHNRGFSGMVKLTLLLSYLALYG